MTRPRTPRLVAVALAVALLAGACSGSEDTSTEPSPSASSEDRSVTTAEVVPPTPEVGACYDLTAEDAAATSTDAAPIPCTDRHTARTVAVGERLLEGDTLAQTCRRRVARFLGGDREARRLSRFTAVWFSPDDDAVTAGAAWFRCDLVAVERSGVLAALPTPLRRGVLARPVARRYALCATAAPGTDRFERVTCEQPHRWRAVTTVDLAPADDGAYPGVRAVRRSGTPACRDAARRISSEDRVRFGFEWPTAEQWDAGQAYGYCWMPRG